MNTGQMVDMVRSVACGCSEVVPVNRYDGQLITPDEIRAGRNKMVPFGQRQGTGWDTAYAALFLASDEARFITGVLLPVDGGAAIRVG